MTDYNWETEQGDKWLANLVALESMMQDIDPALLGDLVEHSANDDTLLRIADIACGGGGTTFEIEKIVSRNAVIHGYDISNSLVREATLRAKQNASHATFGVANMQTKELQSEAYDYLVSRFGVMFFDRPEIAFANIRRWLKPSGRFAFAVWGDPKQNPWMSGIRKVVDQFIELPKPEHDAPGPFRYANIDNLLTLLKESGFSELKLEDWRGQLALGGGLNAHEAVDFALNQFSMTEPLEGVGGSIFADTHKALVSSLTPFENDGVVYQDAYVHIVTGTA